MSATPRDPHTGRFTSGNGRARMVKLNLSRNGQITIKSTSTPTTPATPTKKLNSKILKPSPGSGRSGSTTPTPTPPKKAESDPSGSKLKRKSARIAEKEVSLENTPQLGPSPDIHEGGARGVIHTNGQNDNGSGGVVYRNGEKVFIEPKLAEPTPIYTGLSLESFPSAKVKKESLWPAKYRRSSNRSGSGSNSTSREGSAVPGAGGNVASPTAAGGQPTGVGIISLDELQVEPEIEKIYKKELKTKLGERLTEDSEIRNPVAIKSRPMRTAKLKLIVKTPKPEQQQSPSRSKKRGSAKDDNNSNVSPKRIKIISPKKPSGTNLNAPGAATTTTINKVELATSTSQENNDPTKDNDDFCFACGGPGVFICCETCPKSFHFTCCDPPIEEAPEDDWFCRECTAKRIPGLVKNWNEIGIFGELLNQNETRDSKVFQLPRHLRDETFIGVTTGDNGDYSDDTMKPDIPVGKSSGTQIPGHNRNNDLEIESLYDKYGNPYLCHKCGESGLNNRTLIQCDYCPLVWHIDCLEEPMFGPKTIGNKWRCPNHIEQLFPPGFAKMRQFRDTKVVDNTLHSNFLKIAAMSNIVIKFDDQPYLKPESTPELEEYLEYQSKDFMNSEKAYQNAKILKNWGRNMEAIHPEYEVPDYFQTVSTKNGVAAIASTQLAKVISMTCPRSDGSKDSFIYRIPERSIILDFVSKTKAESERKKNRVMEDISHYEEQGKVERERDESDAVEGLKLMKENSNKKLNFNELLEAVSLAVSEKPSTDDLKDEEIKELLQIKKLMEAKGKAKLLEFLHS
ncbi:uncharacterized protein J8A68_005878 [[Candida] subhashii]|uniref:PHD-type domain-containing protein n=1 Tax=[Candida] subhashii TaxID=561895 RepID=A0A8J5QBK2_9ASCO|nr:uncharacterized protein J8A68_005878 [[Candida] subhashii]KAG7660612.1 hypothetical protein J8A68_005878 [[Candida] subhashii]